MEEYSHTWLWIGCAGMATGAALIALLSLKAPKNESHHFVASFFVTLFAAAAYFAMASGTGVLEAARDGAKDVTVFYARYIDWTVTTPLLLLGLMMIALPSLRGGGEEGRDRNGLIGLLIGADVFMIVTGFVGALTANETDRYVWFGISCLGFLIVLIGVWGPLRKAAAGQSKAVNGLFTRLAGVLTILWLIYPVLWIIGTEGLGEISLDTEITLFAIIDLLAKVGFGLLLVTGVISVYSGRRSSAGAGSARKSTARKPAARKKSTARRKTTTKARRA